MQWLLGTKTGQLVLQLILAAIGTLVMWYFFAEHYKQIGRDECTAAQVVAINSANVDQQKENEAKGVLSIEIAKGAQQNAKEVINKADRDNVSTKKEFDNAYDKPPTTAPIALGSCVHPLDKRVQDGIDRAIEAANR